MNKLLCIPIRTSEHRLISLLCVPTQTPVIFCALGLTSMSSYSKQALPGMQTEWTEINVCGVKHSGSLLCSQVLPVQTDLLLARGQDAI